MPKRMTECSQWDKKWFMALPPRLKCLYKLINDKCDQAGVWAVNEIIAEAYIGEALEWGELPGLFNEGEERVIVLPSGDWWLTGFISFQCGGEPSPRCPAHKPIFALLDKHGIVFDKGMARVSNRVLDRVSNRVFNTQQETETEIDIEKEKETETEKGGVQGGKVQPDPRIQQVLDLWNECRPEECPAAAKLTTDRRKRIQKALEDFPDLGDWRTAFSNIKNHSHYCGYNDRGWKADLDFVLGRNQHRTVMLTKFLEDAEGDSAEPKSIYPTFEETDAML